MDMRRAYYALASLDKASLAGLAVILFLGLVFLHYGYSDEEEANVCPIDEGGDACISGYLDQTGGEWISEIILEKKHEAGGISLKDLEMLTELTLEIPVHESLAFASRSIFQTRYDNYHEITFEMVLYQDVLTLQSKAFFNPSFNKGIVSLIYNPIDTLSLTGALLSSLQEDSLSARVGLVLELGPFSISGNFTLDNKGFQKADITTQGTLYFPTSINLEIYASSWFDEFFDYGWTEFDCSLEHGWFGLGLSGFLSEKVYDIRDNGQKGVVVGYDIFTPDVGFEFNNFKADLGVSFRPKFGDIDGDGLREKIKGFEYNKTSVTLIVDMDWFDLKLSSIFQSGFNSQAIILSKEIGGWTIGGRLEFVQGRISESKFTMESAF